MSGVGDPGVGAAGFPALACRSTRTPYGAYARAACAVRSVDPSSTTMISNGWSLASSERMVFAMPFSSLYAGTITDTGSRTGGPQGRARERACRRAPATSSVSRNRHRPPVTRISQPSPVTTKSEVWIARIRAFPRSFCAALAGAIGPGAPIAPVTVVNV